MLMVGKHTYLCIEAEHEEHEEEEHGPDGAARQQRERLGVDHERQAGT